MAKRAARRAKLHAIDSARVHSLVFDHTPANDRDQSYLRKIRPRSDNQRVLMEAIDSKPLTIAVGPAGTGKTYLAISAAVELLTSTWHPRRARENTSCCNRRCSVRSKDADV